MTLLGVLSDQGLSDLHLGDQKVTWKKLAHVGKYTAHGSYGIGHTYDPPRVTFRCRFAFGFYAVVTWSWKICEEKKSWEI